MLISLDFCIKAAVCQLVWMTGLASAQVATGLRLDLRDLLTMAVTSHPAVTSQHALLRAADQGLSSARWQYFPTFSVSMQGVKAGGADVAYAGDPRVTVLGLTQPLWTGGRIEAGVNKAQALAAGARASLDETRQQLAIRVVQVYGDWLSAYRKRLAYQVGQAQHLSLRDQVARRIHEGQAAASDLALAQGRLTSLEADMALAVTQEEVSLMRLSQLLGQHVSAHYLNDQSAQILPQHEGLSQLLAQAHDNSPSLMRARSNILVQSAAIAETKSATLPEVSLRLEQQHGNFNYAGGPVQTRAFVGVSSKLGAGLSTVSVIREAVQRHASALAEIQVQQRNLTEQIMSDHALLMSSHARRKALEISVAQADEVLASWDRQYLAGRKSWQDLMNSAREQLQVKAQLADLEGSQLVASWRLAIMSGQITLADEFRGLRAPSSDAP